LQEWNVKRLTFEIDTEPYAKVRDENVCNLAEKCGIEIIRKTGHTLYSPNAIVRVNCLINLPLSDPIFRETFS
jgi:cryptochrome